MKGFVENIEGLAVKNDDFRRVLYTAKHCQLVVMALKPNEEIGVEFHRLDQFFRVEEGSGKAILDGVTKEKGGVKQEMDAFKDELKPGEADALVALIHELK